MNKGDESEWLHTFISRNGLFPNALWNTYHMSTPPGGIYRAEPNRRILLSYRSCTTWRMEIRWGLGVTDSHKACSWNTDRRWLPHFIKFNVIWRCSKWDWWTKTQFTCLNTYIDPLQVLEGLCPQVHSQPIRYCCTSQQTSHNNKNPRHLCIRCLKPFKMEHLSLERHSCKKSIQIPVVD